MEPATKQDIQQLKTDIAEMFNDQTRTFLEKFDENSREHEAMKRVTDDHETRIFSLEQAAA